MERYIQRNWFRNLKTKIAARGGNPESSTDIAGAINNDDDVRPARLIQMLAGYSGLTLVLAGLMIILGKMMGDSSGGIKFLSLLPFILGAGLYGFHKMKHPNSDALRELASAFLLITFIMSLFSSIAAFQIEIDPENMKYLMYLVFGVGLAIVYVNKSSLTAIIFLFMLMMWGSTGYLGMFNRMLAGAGSMFGINDALGMILFWGFFAGIVKFLLDSVEMGTTNLKTVILGWAVAIAAYAGVTSMLGGQVFLGQAGLAFALYVFGKKYYGTGSAFWNRPFQTISLIITAMLLIAGSRGMLLAGMLSGSGIGGEFSTENIVGLILALGLLGGTGYYYFENNWKTGNRLNVFMLTVPALAIVTMIFGFAESEDLFLFLAIIYTLAAFALFGMLIKSGLENKYPPIILVGLVFISILIGMKYGANMADFGMYESGLMLIIFGAVYLLIVKMIDKAWAMDNFNNIIPINDNMMDKINKNNPLDKLGDMVDGKDHKPSTPTPTPPPAPAAPSTPDEPSAPDTPTDGGDDAPTDKPEGE